MPEQKPLPDGWKVLSSVYVHKEPWLTVRKDEVQIASGHVIPKYFVLEYPTWINVIAITKENKFVVVKQFRYALGQADYELCAGVTDETDATPLDAAKRELMEETGYGGGTWKEYLRTAPNPATSDNWAITFLATDVELLSSPEPEPSEEISVHLFSFSELLDLMNRGKMVQATHLVALWKYVADEEGRLSLRCKNSV